MKNCPKCNKRMEKALQVVETEATWWEEEGFYVAKPDGKHRIYEKCLICGTELQEDDTQILSQTTKSFDTPEEIRTTRGDVAKARALFKKAGLPFPVLPRKLASSLREQAEWHYSTRPIEVSPYDLTLYLEEAGVGQQDDYVVLSHSGHGANSYAIQYYLVCGPLRMFLFLGWGGAFMDNQKESVKIKECFGLADRIVKAAAGKLSSDSRLTVVASDFSGSGWSRHVNAASVSLSYNLTPQQVLREVLDWLAGL